jgi:hypothetical protein
MLLLLLCEPESIASDGSCHKLTTVLRTARMWAVKRKDAVHENLKLPLKVMI